MTEVLDMNGNTIRIGARTAENDGTVVQITDPDGDTNSYGQQIGINPTVLVEYDDGSEDRYRTRWNATGPWDDDRDDYTCDDLAVQVDEHGQGVNLAAVQRLERFASDRERFHDTRREDFERQHMREPDGQRMEGGRIVPTDR